MDGLFVDKNPMPASSAVAGNQPIALLLAADLSKTTDQQFTMLAPIGARVKNIRIYAFDPAGTLTLAVGGIYTGAGKTGNAIVAASQAYAGIISAGIDLTIGVTTIVTLSQLFLSLTVASLDTNARASYAVYADMLGA